MSGLDAVRAELIGLWKVSAYRLAVVEPHRDSARAAQSILHSARLFTRDLEEHQPQLLDSLGDFKKGILYQWILEEEGVREKPASNTETDWSSI